MCLSPKYRVPRTNSSRIPALVIAILARALPRRHSRRHVDPRTPVRSRRLGGAADADRDGGRARHRQPRLHLDPVEQAARGASARGRGESASALALVMRIALAVLDLHDRRDGEAGVRPGADRRARFARQSQFRDRVFGARPDPDRGRRVPALQGDDRNPSQRRPGRIGFGARQDQQPEDAELRRRRSRRSCCSTWSSRSIRS